MFTRPGTYCKRWIFLDPILRILGKRQVLVRLLPPEITEDELVAGATENAASCLAMLLS